MKVAVTHSNRFDEPRTISADEVARLRTGTNGDALKKVARVCENLGAIGFNHALNRADLSLGGVVWARRVGNPALVRLRFEQRAASVFFRLRVLSV